MKPADAAPILAPPRKDSFLHEQPHFTRNRQKPIVSKKTKTFTINAFKPSLLIPPLRIPDRTNPVNLL